MSSPSILNEPTTLLDGPECLHELIKWHELDQSSIALDFLDADGRLWKYSYGQLQTQITSLARVIEQKIDAAAGRTDSAVSDGKLPSGKKQSIVPVFLPQSPALYIAILAILQAGAAFCPINLDSPSERIKFVVGDVQARVIITTREYEPLVTWNDGTEVIVIDEYPNNTIITNASPFQPRIQPKSSDLAYIMYTSGSSGTPKGVALSHLAATQSLLAHDPHLPTFKRFLQFAAPSFDVSVFEIFFPLFRKATLVGCSRPKLLNDLTGMINQLDVDAAELTPTVVGSLVQTRKNVPGLKLLLTIGEMLTRPVVDEFGSSEDRDGILYGMYGPTEAAIHCTINTRMRAGDKVGNIGIPLSTVSTFICTPAESPSPASEPDVLPIGELGELVLAGPQLANEYINRPEQNAAAFITLNGNPAYRTGDKARQLADGTLEVLGRISAGQVKLRGQRVELGEIEEAVYKNSAIKTAVVSVINGVVVVFALAKTDGITEAEVLNTCSKWLPKFMVPGEIVFLPSFPYLSSGKVDKRKLEAEYPANRYDEKDQSSVTEDKTKMEIVIASALKDLLSIDVSLTARLASVGLDSLMAIRLASVLRSRGVYISPVQVLQAETLTSLASACDSLMRSSDSAPTPHITDFEELQLKVCESSQLSFSADNIDYVLPCTALQDAVLSETAMNQSAYNNQVELEIDGNLEAAKILEAIQMLVERNAILRTSFIEYQSQHSTFTQVVMKMLPSSQISVVSDLSRDASSMQQVSISKPFFVELYRLENHWKALIRIHHAIYDAWSLELMLDDLENILDNVEPNPRPSFRQIVEEELNFASSTKQHASRDYWQDHLAQFDPRPIPNFHTALQSSRGLEISVVETSIPTSSLEITARSLGVSSQSIFQAAYALILSSYEGTEDICFGTVSSGRTSAVQDIKDIVGPCLSTLPVRIDLASSTTVGDLAQRMNVVNRKHLEHASLPLREIKKGSGVAPGRSLFDSLLVWQQTLREYDSQREHVKIVNSTDFLEFNLTVEITPTMGNVQLKANYQKALFPEKQIDLLLCQVEQLVLALIRDPNLQCERTNSELGDNLLSIENSSPTSPATISLSASIETIAEQDPDRVAIEFAHSIDQEHADIERVTYFDLNLRANRIANYLILCGVLPDELVCIIMEKSVDLYVSILGTIKASAGYLPLTPDTPLDRMLHVIDQAKVKIIITHSSIAKKLKSVPSIGLVLVDKVNFNTLSVSNPPLRATDSNLAYCVFTSGSTGTPKGVLVTRGNLMSNLQVLSVLYPHANTSKLLQSCSQAFDVSVFEIFFTWHIGGTLCSAVKDVLFRDMEVAINTLGITHLSLTPTVASLIDPAQVPKVEFLVTAGEAVTEKVFTTWAGHGLWQGYGPSETTNICTVRPRVTRSNMINNIGPPFDNTSVFVLEPGTGYDFVPVPRGAEGEFCFGGDQVGRGYLDKRQEEGRFFRHEKYGRLYRSGDFGRLLPDGSLVFTGRKDDQVKVRGQRVELGEINAVLLRQDTVRDCITMVINGEDDGKTMLVAFWTATQERGTECKAIEPDPRITNALFSALAAAVPSYMIPSALISVTYLPSTSQGKIDKRSLSKIFRSLDKSYLGKMAPSQPSAIDDKPEWSETEQVIAKIVAKTASVELLEVGRDTSFFSLGVDSMSAISLSRHLRDELSLRVEISDVLKYPSVRWLSERIGAENAKSGGTHATNPVPKVKNIELDLGAAFVALKKNEFAQHGHNVSEFWPCTPLQEAMLSTAELTPQAGAYRNHVTLSLQISTQKFQKVWREMVQRHEILRTCFIKTNLPKMPFAQVVLDRYAAKIRVEKNKSTAQIKAILDGQTDTSDEFEPPYVLTIINEPRSRKLLLSMHHALYDGFAVSILFEEIEMLLRGDVLQGPVSFAPFLRHVQVSNTSESDEYWQNLLQGFTPRSFTLSRTNSEIGQGPAGLGTTVTGKEITRITRFTSSMSLRRIEAATMNSRTTLLSVCQAAWTVLLSKYLVQADICFGNIVSGRSAPVGGIDRLVAPCFNSIPIRVKDVHKMSYLELFRNLQAQNMSCLPFQFTPLRRTQSRHAAGRLFDTLVILQPPARKLDSSIWTLIDDAGAMDLPVVIEIVPQPEKDNLQLVLHIHASVLRAYDPAEMLEEFDSILNRALSEPRNFVMSTFARAAVEKNAIATMEAKRRSEKGGSVIRMEQMDPTEKEICDVFAGFTDTPREKIHKDISIHRLGLDSISAVQIASALREKWKNIMASDVLEYPSIKQLAAHLSKSKTDGTTAARDTVSVIKLAEFDEMHRHHVCTKFGIATTDIESIRPCTAVQAGMLAQTLHSVERETGDLEYINSFCMELDAGTEVSRIMKAWSEVTSSVEMLRTGFVAVEPSENSALAFERVPFVMVTYKNDFVKRPILDATDDASRKVFDSLATTPWNLQVTQEEEKTLIKFTAHHALYDAQSLEILLSEVARQCSGEANTSVPSTIGSLLSAILNTADENRQDREAFWKDEKNKISNIRFPELTPLREPRNRTFVLESISSLSTNDLDSLCRQQNVSIQVAGQAAWGRLLAAYTGEISVTFGTTLSGRSILDGSDTIPFPTIVTLPVSFSISGSNTELLERSMKTNAQLHKHQFTPLSSILKWAGDGSGGKMFDTLFAYQKLAPSQHSIKAPWKIVHEQATAEYAVSMELQPMEDGALLLRFTGRENLVPREHARLLLSQYEMLLLDTLEHGTKDCISAPDGDPDFLSVTPAAEVALPGPTRLLHEFVEMQTKTNPHKTALEFTTTLERGMMNTKGWNYEELNAEGNKIANFLLHSIKSDASSRLIAICFDKCPEASFAILGLMKAGFAYVALDPNAPPDRMKFIMADSGADIILTAGKPADVLKTTFKGEGNIKICDLDERLTDHMSSDAPVLAAEIVPEDTCYCLYTSGTTGNPKGCEISHFNAVQAMLAFQHIFAGHWDADSKWLQFASFHFDVSVLEQFWSWSVGICVASAPRDLIFEDIPEAIRKLGITHIDLTPSLARLVTPEDVPNLTRGVFITGGEQLKQEILDTWGEKACIYNGYGPTEATIGVTMYPRVPSTGKPANIGPQFLNVGSYVFRAGTEDPVLRGGVGELCVSGALVGKGYLNREELTKERFPKLKHFNEKVYRTGDLVRILHNGDFLFLGRADDQVKLRGQRLELTEINEVIKKDVHGLDEVATLVLKHTLQQKEQLVTFFVPAPNDKTSQEKVRLIRAACEAHLPGYMVPTHIIAVDKMPLSANNKADSKQLAQKFNDMSMEDLQRLTSAGRSNTTWTDKERVVLQIIASHLQIGVEVVMDSSNIFELGVDSISVIGLSRRLQEKGYQDAKLRTIMKNSSIVSLVKLLASSSTSNNPLQSANLSAMQRIAAFYHRHVYAAATELKLSPSAVEAVAPCTPAQAGMAYEFLGSPDPLYFNQFVFRLEKNVDVERLQQSWEKVASNVQVLRTKFLLTGDGLAQVVIRPEEVNLEWRSVSDPRTDVGVESRKDLRAVGGMEKATALQSPWQISVIKNDENDNQLMIVTIFHALYDGISLPLLLDRVAAEYAGSDAINYGPSFHSALTHGPLADLNLAEAELFFKKHMEGWELPPLAQIDNGSPDATVFVSRVVKPVAHLTTLRQSLGVTDQAILQAVWASALQSVTQRVRIPFGVVFSGRSIDFPDAENVIGPMLNTLPFQVMIGDGVSWATLVKNCHDKNVAMLSWQSVGLKDVQRWISGGKQLFDTLFVFQREGVNIDGELWQELPGESVAEYPIAFEAQLGQNAEINLTIVAKGDVLSKSAAENLLDKVESALQSLQHPDETVPFYGTGASLAEPNISNATIPTEGPETRQFEWTADTIAIRTEIEQLTGSNHVRENVSIFELGLDSIDIIKLASRLKNHGIHLPVSTIVKNQSIAEMAAFIGPKVIAAADDSVPRRVDEYEKMLTQHLTATGKLPANFDSVLPATPLQESMALEMVTSEYARYFNHELFHVASNVDMDKLKQAWDIIIAVNSILRTRLVTVDDVDLPMSFAQVVVPQTKSTWREVDIERVEKIEAAMATLVNEAIRKATSGGELLQLVDIGQDKEHYILLSIAHALYDGWSLRTLHEDVWKVYHGSLTRRPDPRRSLESILKSDTSEAARFWQIALNGSPRSEFPYRQSGRSDVVHRREATSKLPFADIQAFCRSVGISLQTLGQTTWALLLATYLQRLDVVFGAVLSCRDDEESNELMFPLMNTVAVRAVLHGSLLEFLRYMQSNGSAIREYQHFPLRKAKALAGVEGTLFNTLFIYQGQKTQRIGDDKELYKPVESVSEVEFAVCVEMEVVDEVLVFRAACKDSALTEKGIEELLSNFDTVIRTLVGSVENATIVGTSQGISVAGLSSFQNEDTNRSLLPTTEVRTDREVVSKTWTDTENTIRKVLSQVSKVPESDINQHDTIFHLGLDSISAIKVSSILRREGIRLGVNEMAKNNRISSLAELVDSRETSVKEIDRDDTNILLRTLGGVDRDTIMHRFQGQPENVEHILPLSPGQLYMLARWQLSGGAQFVGKFRFLLPEDYQKDRLTEAWRLLVARHSILRTSFAATGRVDHPFVQIVLRKIEKPIEWTTSKAASSKSQSLESPASLSVYSEGGRNVISLQIHHAIYDGISLPILLEDLCKLYANSEQGSQPPPTLDFRSFLAYSFGTDAVSRRKFWTQYLSSAPSSSKGNRPVKTTRRIDVFSPDVAVGNLKTVAQRLGISADALLLAGFAHVYSRLPSDQVTSTANPANPKSVVFGLYLANRSPDGKDFLSLAAPTLNLLPLVVVVESSILESAKRVQSDLWNISSAGNLATSLKEICDWTGTRVDCFVNIVKDPADGVPAEGLLSGGSMEGSSLRRARADVVDVESHAAADVGVTLEESVARAYMPAVDVELRVTGGGSGLDIGVFAAEELMDQATAASFTGKLGELLRGLE